jgi:hypothetical protein
VNYDAIVFGAIDNGVLVLGMLLGVRLWYAFYGPTLVSEGAFESKMEELCRELGGRGK